MGIIFDEETGLLKPGEYKMTIEEFKNAFVYNHVRERIFEGFLKLVDIFTSIECTHLYVDGSYVTTKPHPGDIDVCWYMSEDKEQKDKQFIKLIEICRPLFYLNDVINREFIQKEFCADVFPANTKEGVSGIMFKDFFQKDKHTGAPKGIVIIELL